MTALGQCWYINFTPPNNHLGPTHGFQMEETLVCPADIRVGDIEKSDSTYEAYKQLESRGVPIDYIPVPRPESDN